MNRDQQDALRNLPDLEGVLRRGDYEELVAISLTPVPRASITLEEFKERMRSQFWDAHRPIPYQPDVVLEKPKDIPNADHMKFLMAVFTEPFKWFGYYINKLVWGASKGTRVRDQLIAHQFIAVYAINTFKRGSKYEALELLVPAYKALNVEPPENHIRGKVEHRWWCHRVREHLQKEFPNDKIVFEKQLYHGTAVDVFVEGKGLAFEIQLNCRHELVRNLLVKSLQAQIALTICVPRQEDIEKVKTVIVELEGGPDLFGCAEKVREMVTVKMLAEFL